MNKKPGWLLLISLLLLSACQAQSNLSTPTPDIEADNAALDVAWNTGDFETSASLLPILIEADSQNALFTYRYGILTLLDDPETGITWLERAAALDENYAQPANQLQNALLLANQQTDPGYQKMILGQTLASINEWQAAAALFEQVTNLNPTYSEAWAYLGEARQQIGENGLPELTTAYGLNPDSLAANLFLGLYWRRQNQPEAALTYLEKANQLAPNTREIQIELGQTLAQTGDVNQALSYFEAITNEAPDKKEAWQSLALYSIDNQVFLRETGLPAAREAYLLAQDDPENALLLGRIYALLSEPLLAERFYQQAIELNPEYAEAHYYFALLYLAEGDYTAAQTQLLQAKSYSTQPLLTEKIEMVIKNYFP